MAQHFRLVNYDNLPRYAIVYDYCKSSYPKMAWTLARWMNHHDIFGVSELSLVSTYAILNEQGRI